MGIEYLVEDIVNTLYTNKKNAKEFERIKQESGVQEKDWNLFLASISEYPEDAKTVLEAKNEDHVKLYDKDKQELLDIKNETMQLLKQEIPEIYGDTPKYRIFSINGSLSDIRKYLYGAESDRDIQSDVQIIFSNFDILLEETDKNVKRTQKGKNGEDYVGDVLRQYGDKFHFLENIVIPAYDAERKTSETDVYIVNSKGIFVCEVKNYGNVGQTLYMPEIGEWQLVNEYGRLLANKPSAFVQNHGHCNATRSFIGEHLGIEVPIYSVIIIANNDVQIQNANPNKHIVIRPQNIGELVECCEDAIDNETQKNIIEAFEKYKLDPNDFPVKINANKARCIQKWVKEYIPYIKANVKMAEVYKKSKDSNKKVAWAITIALTIIGMMPFIKEGEGLVILLGILAWGLTYCADSLLSLILSIAAVILLTIWIITLNPPLAVIGIVCMGIGYWRLNK